MGSLAIDLQRELPAPVDEAFGWLTDFEAGDADRAGAILAERPVLEEGEDHVLLEARYGPLGLLPPARMRVDLLDPPRRWRATYVDGPVDGEVTYVLEPAGDERSRLAVSYVIEPPTGLGWASPLAAPLVRRRLHRMWDGYEEAMRREL